MVSLGAWLENTLYLSCRFLTREQMLNVEGDESLLHWYANDLMGYFKDNYENVIEREKYQKEANRIGIILKKDERGLFSSEILPYKSGVVHSKVK